MGCHICLIRCTIVYQLHMMIGNVNKIGYLVYRRLFGFSSRTTVNILLGIVIVAFVTRFILSVTKAPWLDETTLYVLSKTYTFKGLFFYYHWDKAHPFLMYWMTRATLLIFHNNFLHIEFLRIFSVIVSTFSVLSVYIFVRKMLSEKSALIFSVWFSFCYINVLMGFLYRPYALLQMLFPLAGLVFFQKNWNSWPKIVLVNGLFSLMFFWDYASVYFFITYFLYIALYSLQKRIIFRSLIPFFLIVLWWAPRFLNQAIVTKDIMQNYQNEFIPTFLRLIGVNASISESPIGVFIFAVTLIIIIANVMYQRTKKLTPYTFLSTVGLLLYIGVALIDRFFIKILVDHHLIFLNFLLLLSFTPLLIHPKFGRLYGIGISIFICINSSSILFSPWIGKTFVSVNPPTNPVSGRTLFITYDDQYTDYPVKYNLLSKGYSMEDNNEKKYLNGQLQLEFDFCTLKHTCMQKDIPSYDHIIFLSEGERLYSQRQQEEILRVCDIFQDYAYSISHAKKVAYHAIICR